ncbi:MAG: translation initiation factor [Planctomycetota bacterium]
MTRLFAGTQWDQPPQCDDCGKLQTDCNCPPSADHSAKPLIEPSKQTAKLAVEKRKRGKLMTVIRGLPATDNDLPALLSRLKSECGAGGTIKDDTLEIQGDHLDRLAQVLASIGYRVQ